MTIRIMFPSIILILIAFLIFILIFSLTYILIIAVNLNRFPIPNRIPIHSPAPGPPKWGFLANAKNLQNSKDDVMMM